MVFDGEAQKMLEIDPAARKYTELTQADAQVLAEQMQAAMAHVPPEQRARIEAMRAARAEAVKHDVKYQPTGKRDTVAGYACQGYTVIRDGEEKREGCFIPWGSAVKKEDFAALNEMGKFLDTIYSRAYGAPTQGELRITEQIERAPGFPAVIEQVSGGKRQPEHRLVSIKRTSISADVFQAPAGYTKQEHEAMGLGRAARRGK